MPDTALHLVAGQLPYLLKGAFPQGALAGAALTLWMALLACLGATIVGIGLACWLELAPATVARPVRAGLAFLRAIPVVMLIFWTYFLLPMLAGVQVGEVSTVVVALAAIGASYIAQTMSAGFAAIGRGQHQAALALGMTPAQSLRLVLLPPTLRAMLPSLANTWVSLTKDTSLAYVVGVVELSTAATQVNGRNMGYAMEIFAAVAVIYFIVCAAIEQIGRRGLRRMR
ncbi:amino acid ABC transporter membrane protein 2, PAAT family [Cupriavidus sp. YR651]|uniref:amino acid ABC transporter permease n=1 Tax=Cupriavidus sp. YR651 TaxID=1855315 RepID=UPI00088B0A5C|nr:amino acid ABC transporter permease [Cupriavidus sp. YR651]SDD39682.1 amino acid ABC transporter membrane protein 2, PAAT family [Cupriavidus sp. YR651]